MTEEESNKECKMESKLNEIEINKVIYVPKKERQTAIKHNGLDYVIIRARDAGCFAGYLKDSQVSSGLRTAILIKCRRLWYWDGAASLSQLAMEGVSKPDNCKFPCEVDEIQIDNVIETIKATEKARLSIAGVKIWNH